MRTEISTQDVYALEIPRSVAICLICGSDLVVDEIDEYYEDGSVSDCGLKFNCSTEPNIDSDEWEEWFNRHWSQPYIDWLPLQKPVIKWFNDHYRII